MNGVSKCRLGPNRFQRIAESLCLCVAAQQRAIDDFRSDLLGLRAELRDVQFALGQDVERLQFRIKALNIWAVPALVALVAIVLALARRLRAASYRTDREAVS